MPIYPGAGQAKLINPTEQKFFWDAESVGAEELSFAFQIGRQTSMYYPWGFAVEIQFSGDPGTFEVDIMASETDMPGNYVEIGKITAVNGSYVGRFDTVAFWPRYIALYMDALENSVTISAKVTR